MPDHRKHRGPHPQDTQLFAVEALADLQAATMDLSWLQTKGYASTSALKLVGDRHRLNSRQRVAVARCACGDKEILRRREHELEAADLRGQELWIDGYNVLITIEAALAGGVVLRARDGCYRDMASMHGSYRKVAETIPAIEILGEVLQQTAVESCHWLLDQPVSNSGRLRTKFLESAEARGWNWSVELVPDPDVVLKRTDKIVVSSDSQILDEAQRWFNLAKCAIDTRVDDVWILDLSR